MEALFKNSAMEWFELVKKCGRRGIIRQMSPNLGILLWKMQEFGAFDK